MDLAAGCMGGGGGASGGNDLNQSYGFNKHLYVRFSFWLHLLQNTGGWISLDMSKWKQFLSEACALVCTRVAF